MGKTASMVMKIIGASLAFAAVVCLIIGGWNEIAAGANCLKSRMCKKSAADEYEDYADEEMYE